MTRTGSLSRDPSPRLRHNSSPIRSPRRKQVQKVKKINTRLYKTNLCRTFTKTGSCPYGSKCQFAHGEEELKPIPKDLDDRPEDDIAIGVNSPFNVSVLYAGTNNAAISTPRSPILVSPRPIVNNEDDDVSPASEDENPWVRAMQALDSESPRRNRRQEQIEEDPDATFSLRLNLSPESPRVLNVSTKASIQSPRISMLNLSTPNKEAPIPNGARVDCDPRLYKTELCRSYSQSGSCRYGEKCQFAHGIEELRPAPQRVRRDGTPSSPRSMQRKEPLSPRIVRLQIDDDAKMESEGETKVDFSNLRLQISPTRYSNDANFSPSRSSPRIKDPRVYKTELCKKFEAMGECPYGLKCQFAHGVQELRPRVPMTTTNASFPTREFSQTPKGSPDPKLYKTELCRSFNRTGYCRYGLKCQFAHGIHELRPSPRASENEARFSIRPADSPQSQLKVLHDSKYVADSPRNLTVSPIVGSPRKKAPASAPSRTRQQFTFQLEDI